MSGKKIVVVLPAYNAERTLERTYREIPHDIVDHVVLVDDYSGDDTVEIARQYGLDVIRHDRNRGYGANQKTCYRRACELGADIVVMLHPDYQYPPRLIPAMVALISNGLYDVVLGSRILGTGARAGGMPLYKYVANRFLTGIENLLIGQKLSEFHTGYRAFTRKAFDLVRFESNSDDFLFDNQMLVQCHAVGLRIAEITCPTHYFSEASSINFRRSVVYGLGCLWVGLQYLAHRMGLITLSMFQPRA